MNTEERERALLKLVEDERDKVCSRLLAEADERARTMVRDAYQRERAALHQRIVAERSRAEGILRAAAAERATAERRRGEQADARLIAAAWPRLQAQLAERWSNPDQRRRWVQTTLAQAIERLPSRGWTIRHAGGWPQAEREAALAQLAQAGISPPALRADGDLEAGLVVAAGGAVLDMSLEGLLRDRARIEARLLALAKGRHQPRGGARTPIRAAAQEAPS
ncbi:MAG: hypothetical protein PVJ47_10325 [Thiohalocapsa sp.]|jgi:hypothetical protein|uniref:hypothetical protein n=1 Tax=Thiohalocapsa sp. TaxID=2497641 RepID=UPI0025F660AF|nr:hypothetical protein [Thiohalocapsa sp.]